MLNKVRRFFTLKGLLEEYIAKEKYRLAFVQDSVLLMYAIILIYLVRFSSDSCLQATSLI